VHTATDSTKSLLVQLTLSVQDPEADVRSVSFTVRTHNQEIIVRLGCFTAAVAK